MSFIGHKHIINQTYRILIVHKVKIVLVSFIQSQKIGTVLKVQNFQMMHECTSFKQRLKDICCIVYQSINPNSVVYNTI